MLVNVVSAGGNLLLIVNLEAQGALPELLHSRLSEVGKWLKINGEGIYETRSYSVFSENNVRYTRSKDNKTVYAVSLDWPGNILELESVEPVQGSNIYMLGYDQPLKWQFKNGKMTLFLPDELQKEANRPCEYAYTFKISVNCTSTAKPVVKPGLDYSLQAESFIMKNLSIFINYINFATIIKHSHNE
jgi:alpha-L-fucosidase